MAGKVQKKTGSRKKMPTKSVQKKKAGTAVSRKSAIKGKAKTVVKSKTAPKSKVVLKAKIKAKVKAKAKAKVITKAAPKIKTKVIAKSAPKVKVVPMVLDKLQTKTEVKQGCLAKQHVGSERIEKLRKILLQKRAEIINESKVEIKKYVAGEKRQLVETVLDEGDLSVVDLAEDINLKQLSTHRETLQKIDVALRKFNEGTYGCCDECGDEISFERLAIMPFAILCRDCQEDREVREKIERDNSGTL
jgi:DnaK suppressor protein